MNLEDKYIYVDRDDYERNYVRVNQDLKDDMLYRSSVVYQLTNANILRDQYQKQIVDALEALREESGAGVWSKVLCFLCPLVFLSLGFILPCCVRGCKATAAEVSAFEAVAPRGSAMCQWQDTRPAAPSSTGGQTSGDSIGREEGRGEESARARSANSRETLGFCQVESWIHGDSRQGQARGSRGRLECPRICGARQSMIACSLDSFSSGDYTRFAHGCANTEEVL